MTKDDKIIVLHCGLVCSKCIKFIDNKCAGCFTDTKLKLNCKIRECVKKRSYRTCVECQQFSEFTKCKKFNSLKNILGKTNLKQTLINNIYKIKMQGLKEFKEMQKEDKS